MIVMRRLVEVDGKVRTDASYPSVITGLSTGQRETRRGEGGKGR